MATKVIVVTESSKSARIAVDNASLADLREALTQGHATSSELTQAYLARIEAYDRNGPGLNSVRVTNPDALSIAAGLDAVKPSAERPLAGLPILVKDNIATGDRQPTTAGSLALAGAHARDDAPVVRRLRDAGAVILGKANLTEFANVLAMGMPSGYSSIAGYVRNPYSPKLMDDHAPVVLPGGSSAGSAVAVAAGLCAASIGTETSGSLLSPATQNGLVTVKPTVGLISRSGIIPISHSQDTAGPMTRTVRDSAILLNVLAARDPDDPATYLLQRPEDYTASLDKDGLKGARIGVPSDPADPLNDPFHGPLSRRGKGVMAQAIKVLEDLGAVIVRAAIPAIGWIGGPGTTMPVLNRNPFSPGKGTPGPASVVFLYELKRDLNLYLRDWGDPHADQDHGRRDRVQHGERRQSLALWTGPVPGRRADLGRSLGAGIQVGARDGPDGRQGPRHGCLYEPAQTRRRGVPRRQRRGHRGQAGLSECPGAGRFHLRCRQDGNARLSARPHIRRPRLERGHAAAPRLRLRAGNAGTSPAAGLAGAVAVVASDGFTEFMREQLAPLGRITTRRMFGKTGVFCRGLMLGIVSDDTLYLRVDDQNRALFKEVETARPLRYVKKGVTIDLAYWPLPDRLLDEPDELLIWARAALAAARRVAARRERKGSKAEE